MKNKFTSKLTILMFIVNFLIISENVFADAQAYKYKNCITHKKYQVSGWVGRSLFTNGQKVNGIIRKLKNCNNTVSFYDKYYEGSTYCGFAKASSGSGGASNSDDVYCATKKMEPGGYLSYSVNGVPGTVYLAAGNYDMGSGTYFVSTSNIIDTMGLSRGDVNIPIIDIDYFDTPKGKIIIPNINGYIAVKANSDFGQLFRIIVFSSLDSLDTLITPQKILWEGSVRIEHGQLIVTGGFMLSDFGITYTTENITDSSNNFLYSVPAMKAFPIGDLLNNGLSLDIQNDIINQLLINNPRQVPLSVIQNANADNVGVRILVAGGYGNFVDDITPHFSIPIPTLSQWGLIIFSFLLFGAIVWYLRKRKLAPAALGIFLIVFALSFYFSSAL